jgi:DnaJ homolog subfamily C member 9
MKDPGPERNGAGCRTAPGRAIPAAKSHRDATAHTIVSSSIVSSSDRLPMHVIYEAFGQGANLYELLRVDRSVDGAGLRKAYYKTALVYHPDKQPQANRSTTEDAASNTTTTTAAALKFQAVTAAYQILQDAEKRQIYDETGFFGGLDDDDDINADGTNPWKDYFDRIFGRVTLNGIDQFAQSYKCSDEEKRHVLEQYENCHGNLVKMLDYVMLSTPRDAIRWVDDYLRPALTAGDIIDSQYTSTMEKTLKKVRVMVEKEEKEERERQQDDEQQTESEEEEEEEKTNKNGSKKKKPTKKPVSTGNHGKKRKNAAAAADKNDMSSLIAQIQNKNKRGGGNTMADFAARYGVTMNDDDDHDPLADDDAFRRAQAKVQDKQKKKQTKTAQPQRQQQSKRNNKK